MAETALLLLGFCSTTLIACALCWWLAAPGVAWHARLTTVIAWASSYFIILLFPADLATSFTNGAEVGRGVYEGIWRFAYWNTQIMCNLCIPFQQSYVSAGDFTAKDRLKRFGKENLRKLVAILVVGVGALVLIFFKFRQLLTISNLLSLIISVGNMYALVFCVLLLGYGCVEIPRHLWYYGDMGRALKVAQYRAVALDAKSTDARSRLAVHASRALQAERLMAEGHPLRPHLEVVLRKVPAGFDVEGAASLMDAGEAAAATWRPEDCTLPRLVELHRDVKDAALAYVRAEHEWAALVREAAEAADVLANAANTTKLFRSSRRPQRRGRRAALDAAEWWWKCRVRQPLCRLAAGVLMAMSAAVVWSEVSMFATRSLSPFGLLLRPSLGLSFAALQTIAAVPLAYIVACAYFTIYRIRLFSLYQLHGRQTDAFSLLFNAGYVARISSALCYNYINMLNLGGDLPLTGFERVMGPALSFFGSLSEAFNLYFPLLVGVSFLLHALDVPRRVLARLGLAQLLTEGTIEEDHLEEGARLLAAARRQHEREAGAKRVRRASGAGRGGLRGGRRGRAGGGRRGPWRTRRGEAWPFSTTSTGRTRRPPRATPASSLTAPPDDPRRPSNPAPPPAARPGPLRPIALRPAEPCRGLPPPAAPQN